MERLTILGKVAGIVIIIFGLHTMGVLRIGWLYREKRFQSSNRPTTMLGAMLVGIAFAFGWTPCIGPILAAINSFFTAFAKIRRHYRAIEIVSGLLMVVVGILIFTNRFTIIAQWLTPYLPVF